MPPKFSELILIMWVLCTLPVIAFAADNRIQYSLRSGVISGQFTGATSGDFLVPTSLEGEVKFGKSPTQAQIVKGSIALEPETGIVKYLYSGGGQRFFLRSRYSEISAGGLNYNLHFYPKAQYFLGWDLGISQVHVQDLTDPISIQATVLEYGLMAGLGYKFSSDYGLDAVFSISKGLAISSVEIDSVIMRILVGVTIY